MHSVKRVFCIFHFITDPTTGGVTASFAMLGDVILAEPEAADWVCRTKSNRADNQTETSRRLPEIRVYGKTWFC